MWHLKACKISVSLSFLNGLKMNDFLLYFWMLATLIQRYSRNHFIFDPVQERETNWNFTGCQMPYFFIVLIPYICLLNLSWIKNVYEEYGAFKVKGEQILSLQSRSHLSERRQKQSG